MCVPTMDLDFLLGEHKEPPPPYWAEPAQPKVEYQPNADSVAFAYEQGRNAYQFLGGVFGPKPPPADFRFEVMNQAFIEGYTFEYEKAQQEITSG